MDGWILCTRELGLHHNFAFSLALSLAGNNNAPWYHQCGNEIWLGRCGVSGSNDVLARGNRYSTWSRLAHDFIAMYIRSTECLCMYICMELCTEYSRVGRCSHWLGLYRTPCSGPLSRWAHSLIMARKINRALSLLFGYAQIG